MHALKLVKVKCAIAVTVYASHNQVLVGLVEHHTESAKSLHTHKAVRSTTDDTNKHTNKKHLLELVEIKSARTIPVQLIKHGPVLVVSMCLLHLVKAFLE